MAMQSILITLRALANSIVSRSKRGIVCIVLNDENITGVKIYTRLKNVTDKFSIPNKAIITRCFADRGVKTLKVACYNASASIPETISTALDLLDGVKFNYLSCPYATDADNALITAFVKNQRKNNNILVKAVLYNHAGDYEGIINFINNKIVMSDNTIYTGVEFTVDVACLLANCSLTSSITNAKVDGVKSIDIVDTDLDSAEESGKLFLFYDNDLESVVFSRGVNSKTTIGIDEKESLKKIRIIDVLDMIRDDLKISFKQDYQGKKTNTYENKKLFISAINTYFRALKKETVLSDVIPSIASLDKDAITSWLESKKGVDTSVLKDEQILAYDTDTFIFAIAACYIMDCMEDLQLILQF